MAEDRISILKPDRNEAPWANRTVTLVGLMGAGKSTVGRRLANRLGRVFYDSDNEIEKAAGQSVTDIFSMHGEEEFRRGEHSVLKRLLDEEPHILATGGGAFLNPDTRALMREKSVTIWLNADLETLWKRVSRRNHRPLLRRPDAKEVLSNLFEERRSIYELADLTVQSVDGPHSKTVTAIIKALETWTPQP